MKEAVTILISFLLGYAVDEIWGTVVKNFKIGPKKNDYHKFIIKRVRIHHNLFGYVAIIFGFFHHPLILTPFGIGMIVGHRIHDRLFWFSEIIAENVQAISKEVETASKEVEKVGEKIKKEINKIPKKKK